MSVITPILTVNELWRVWGERLPTWDEFKRAHSEGSVLVNKKLAFRALSSSSLLRSQYIIHGIIVPWVLVLAPIAGIFLFILGYINALVMVACLAASIFLHKANFISACHAIGRQAAANEDLYVLLLRKGAFFFRPPSGLH